MCKKEYINRHNGEKLDCTMLDDLRDKSLLKHRPDIWESWDFDKNKELGYNIEDVALNGSKRYWHICKSCNVSSLRLFRISMTDSKCNDCKLLKNKYPELFKQLHPTKNEGINLDELTYGSKKKVWWLGECSHEWETRVGRRAINNEGCIYCGGNRNTLIGFNDMWTTNPAQASWLLNPEDGYKYREQSEVKVDWKCPNCSSILRNQRIAHVRNHKLVCHKCSDGFSFATKVFISVLNQNNILFEREKVFKWSMNRRYDFYLKLNNKTYIIELHGSQHYKEEFQFEKSRTLEEEQVNDELKQELAIKNGIDKCIIIDCRKSELEWIKNNLIESELNSILDFDSIDWVKVLKDSNISIMMECLKWWNEGVRSPPKIGDRLGVSEETVRKYLKMLTKEGICDYDPKKRYRKNNGCVGI